MNQKKRLADFTVRAEEPAALRDIGELGRYVTVDLMADEAEVLASINVAASDCIKVDLYWEFEGDVRFVQIQTKAYADAQTVGVYARMAPSGYVNIVVVVDELVISSTVVEDALKLAAGAHLHEHALSMDLRKL